MLVAGAIHITSCTKEQAKPENSKLEPESENIAKSLRKMLLGKGGYQRTKTKFNPIKIIYLSLQVYLCKMLMFVI